MGNTHLVLVALGLTGSTAGVVTCGGLIKLNATVVTMMARMEKTGGVSMPLPYPAKHTARENASTNIKPPARVATLRVLLTGNDCNVIMKNIPPPRVANTWA